MFLAHVSDIAHNLVQPLIQFDMKKSLVHNNEFKIINNVCPHQGSLIITEMTDRVSCRYHGWSWNTHGEPVNSGTTRVCNNFTLPIKSTVEIHSLIFTDMIDLSEIHDIDLSFMTLQETRIDSVNTDFRNLIDVFLDVDHIPVVHKTVYDDLGIGTEVSWKYYDWGSIQLVEKSTEYSKEFQNTLTGMPVQQLAAFWIAVYPYTTIEWQPGAMFVNVCVPKEDHVDVCVFKYQDSRYNNTNWKINSEVWETAWQQDREQAEAIVNRSIFEPHLEPSKIHFREHAIRNNL